MAAKLIRSKSEMHWEEVSLAMMQAGSDLCN
jgi:hypothetical protein